MKKKSFLVPIVLIAMLASGCKIKTRTNTESQQAGNTESVVSEVTSQGGGSSQGGTSTTSVESIETTESVESTTSQGGSESQGGGTTESTSQGGSVESQGGNESQTTEPHSEEPPTSETPTSEQTSEQTSEAETVHLALGCQKDVGYGNRLYMIGDFCEWSVESEDVVKFEYITEHSMWGVELDVEKGVQINYQLAIASYENPSDATKIVEHETHQFTPTADDEILLLWSEEPQQSVSDHVIYMADKSEHPMELDGSDTTQYKITDLELKVGDEFKAHMVDTDWRGFDELSKEDANYPVGAFERVTAEDGSNNNVKVLTAGHYDIYVKIERPQSGPSMYIAEHHEPVPQQEYKLSLGTDKTEVFENATEEILPAQQETYDVQYKVEGVKVLKDEAVAVSYGDTPLTVAREDGEENNLVQNGILLSIHNDADSANFYLKHNKTTDGWVLYVTGYVSDDPVTPPEPDREAGYYLTGNNIFVGEGQPTWADGGLLMNSTGISADNFAELEHVHIKQDAEVKIYKYTDKNTELTLADWFGTLGAEYTFASEVGGNIKFSRESDYAFYLRKDDSKVYIVDEDPEPYAEPALRVIGTMNSWDYANSLIGLVRNDDGMPEGTKKQYTVEFDVVAGDEFKVGEENNTTWIGSANLDTNEAFGDNGGNIKALKTGHVELFYKVLNNDSVSLYINFTQKINSFGLVGTLDNVDLWDNDVEMLMDTEHGLATLENYPFQEGDIFKFRANHNWLDKNIGYANTHVLPAGCFKEQEGNDDHNFECLKTSQYSISLNINTGVVTITERQQVLDSIEATYSGGSIKVGEHVNMSKISIVASYDFGPNHDIAYNDAGVEYYINSAKINLATFEFTEGMVADGVDVTVKYGGKEDVLHLDVVSALVPATGASIEETNFSLKIDQTKQLHASATPNDTTDGLEWLTSNSSVATVSATGLVTAVGVGNAIITAKYNETAKATVTVTVTDWGYQLFVNDVEVEGLTLNNDGKPEHVTEQYVLDDQDLEAGDEIVVKLNRSKLTVGDDNNVENNVVFSANKLTVVKDVENAHLYLKHWDDDGYSIWLEGNGFPQAAQWSMLKNYNGLTPLQAHQEGELKLLGVELEAGDTFIFMNGSVRAGYVTLKNNPETAAKFEKDSRSDCIKVLEAGRYDFYVDISENPSEGKRIWIAETPIDYGWDLYVNDVAKGVTTQNASEVYHTGLELTAGQKVLFKCGSHTKGYDEIKNDLPASVKACFSKGSNNELVVVTAGTYDFYLELDEVSLGKTPGIWINKVEPVTEKTIYFTNNQGWATVKCYAWNNTENNSWPGVTMEYVGKNGYNQDVYKVVLDVKYTNVIFNNGSGTQTVDIDISDVDTNTQFWPTEQEGGKWKVGSGAYSAQQKIIKNKGRFSLRVCFFIIYILFLKRGRTYAYKYIL